MAAIEKIVSRPLVQNLFKYYGGKGCRARALAYGDILGPDPGCIVYSRSVINYGNTGSPQKRELISV